MFDKLIVSEPKGADFKNRRSYFIVSSLVVGALFVTAVVISIYSADIGLGNDRFDLAELLPPITMAEAPEPQRPKEPAATSPERNTVPERQVLMASVNQPTIAPITTSTAANPYASIPDGLVRLGPRDTPGSGSGRTDPGTGTGDPVLVTTPEVVENTPIPEPPPVKAPLPVNRPTQSLGVINGNATYLPPPPYPPAAKAIHLTGKVDVQVMIDESGKVVSASAVSGPPILKDAAERAAWNARFSPTYLSKVAVKVTGVIVYNFAM